MLNRYALTPLTLATALALAPLAGAQDELFKLNASDGAAGDQFGLRVSIYNGLIAVGAWNDDVLGAGSDAGSAYLFSASSGLELKHLTANDAADGDWFGISVSAADSMALVGACNDDDLGSDSGSAYIFNAITGTQLFKVTASNGAAGDLFGARVDYDGSSAIVAAPFGDGAVTDSGAVYVFDMTTGTELQKLQANDGAASDLFGMSAAISGNRAIVGAFQDGPLGVGSGSAYIFNSTNGQQLFKLIAGDGSAGQNFGSRVEIEGDRAIVGAWAANGAQSTSGAAYIFNVNNGAQLFKLTASDGQTGDNFGASVGISGRLAVVGAPTANNGTGASYIFDITTGQELYKLTASDGAAGDEYGSAAIDGDYTVISAVGDNDLGPDSGSVYVYSTLQGPALSYCFGDNSGNACPCGNLGGFGDGCGNSSVQGANLSATGSRSASADDLAFAGESLLPSQPALLFVGNNQVQSGNGALFGDGLRCAGGSVKRLGVQVPNASGNASWGPGLGAAGGWSAGATRRFQCWYRDPAGWCGSGFNLSNGLEVVFTP
jgi:outer membrane protein assembly factor BamB